MRGVRRFASASSPRPARSDRPKEGGAWRAIGQKRGVTKPAPPAIAEAMSDLWRLPASENLYASPAFKRLLAACQDAYDNADNSLALSFGLGDALRNLGLPSARRDGDREPGPDADEAAARLHHAFTCRTGTRIHLCPLDLADTLPTITFGPATVRMFAPDELARLFDRQRLGWLFPDQPLDLGRLAQVQWLVVSETTDLSDEPGRRAIPFLYDMREDLGRIAPHEPRVPAPVEDALFLLLLQPWEDWITMHEVDWRGFRIPWVYTVDDDIFIRPKPPPSADTLTWREDCYTDAVGEPVEVERPEYLNLEEDAAEPLASLGQAEWERVADARASPLFETPVAHFLVRAFFDERLDAFLAHLFAIEAALGLPSDHDGKLRPKPDPAPGWGASRRVKGRLAGLLDDADAAEGYRRLLRLRNEFVHGRTMAPISTEDQVAARRLARRTVGALVDLAAASGGRAREDALTDLLVQGKAILDPPAG